MRKLLRKLFNRDWTTSSEPIDTNVSREEILQVLRSTTSEDLENRKKYLRRFVQFCTSSLDDTESQRLCRVAELALDRGVDSFSALHDITSGDEGQTRGQWVFIQLDWKATEEVAWQVTEVLTSRGVSDRWQHDPDAEFRSVPEVLLAFSDWLSHRNLALLHVETDADSYCCFVVNSSDVATVRKLAIGAELTLYEHAEFAERDA